MNRIKEISDLYGQCYRAYFWVNADEENEAISYVDEYVERPVHSLIFHSGNRDAIFSVIESVIECKIGRYKDDPYMNVETYKINKKSVLDSLQK
jgi:hypothetical protein